MRRFDTDRCEDMYLFLTPGIRQGDPQSVRAAVNVLAHKAAINGYKSAEIEVRVAPGPSWSSVMPNEQSVALYKEAMTLLNSKLVWKLRSWPKSPVWKPQA